MKPWGAVLVFIGIASTVLPELGVQFRLVELFGGSVGEVRWSSTVRLRSPGHHRRRCFPGRMAEQTGFDDRHFL